MTKPPPRDNRPFRSGGQLRDDVAEREHEDEDHGERHAGERLFRLEADERPDEQAEGRGESDEEKGRGKPERGGSQAERLGQADEAAGDEEAEKGAAGFHGEEPRTVRVLVGLVDGRTRAGFSFPNRTWERGGIAVYLVSFKGPFSVSSRD
jgi:hypothetical protein